MLEKFHNYFSTQRPWNVFVRHSPQKHTHTWNLKIRPFNKGKSSKCWNGHFFGFCSWRPASFDVVYRGHCGSRLSSSKQFQSSSFLVPVRIFDYWKQHWNISWLLGNCRHNTVNNICFSGETSLGFEVQVLELLADMLKVGSDVLWTQHPGIPVVDAWFLRWVGPYPVVLWFFLPEKSEVEVWFLSFWEMFDVQFRFQRHFVSSVPLEGSSFVPPSHS